ncbi:MAG: DUF3008 domain-containing protein [Deltaproteobacteria bacterium]|nr:MAG: DUF3008 domain-containing protein [Deltaproteobacteria bacterium]
MPATSRKQRRLMGMAYAYKKGKRRLTDFPPSVRDEIKKIASSMTLKQLRDFAKTPEKKLPVKKRRKK